MQGTGVALCGVRCVCVWGGMYKNRVVAGKCVCVVWAQVMGLQACRGRAGVVGHGQGKGANVCVCVCGCVVGKVCVCSVHATVCVCVCSVARGANRRGMGTRRNKRSAV